MSYFAITFVLHDNIHLFFFSYPSTRGHICHRTHTVHMYESSNVSYCLQRAPNQTLTHLSSLTLIILILNTTNDYSKTRLTICDLYVPLSFEETMSKLVFPYLNEQKILKTL